MLWRLLFVARALGDKGGCQFDIFSGVAVSVVMAVLFIGRVRSGLRFDEVRSELASPELALVAQ